MRKLTELFKVRLRWLTPRRTLSRMRILMRVRAMEVVVIMECGSVLGRRWVQNADVTILEQVDIEYDDGDGGGNNDIANLVHLGACSQINISS